MTAYADVATDISVDFPADWTWTAGGSLLAGQLIQGVHGPTGGGCALRASTFDPATLPASVRARVGDVDAALSADRYAVALSLSQADDSRQHTVYLGMSDTVGATVGRWVFTSPATGADPARIWWHDVWKTSTRWAQLVAWAPEDQVARFVPAMRDLEAHLGSVSGYVAGPPMVARLNGDGCDGPASVDRMAAIAGSTSFARAKAALNTGDWTPEGRSIAELQAISTLVQGVDVCLHARARADRACEIWERPSDTARSQLVQADLVDCLGRDASIRKGLDQALTVR